MSVVCGLACAFHAAGNSPPDVWRSDTGQQVYTKLLPVCEHAFPSSRAEMLIRTIAETNIALWTLGRPGEL